MTPPGKSSYNNIDNNILQANLMGPKAKLEPIKSSSNMITNNNNNNLVSIFDQSQRDDMIPLKQKVYNENNISSNNDNDNDNQTYDHYYAYVWFFSVVKMMQ